MAAKYQFIMRSGPTVGKVTSLTTPEITIGRDTSNTITINDAEVSRKHARMELRGSTYALQDLGSTNGTLVNGKPISSMQTLNTGDIVSFGEGISLEYQVAEDSNATVLSSKPPATAVQKPAVVPAVPRTQIPTPTATPTPIPAPVSRPVPAVPPAPVYSGHIPAGPVPASSVPAGSVPMPPEEAATKKKFPIWVIIVILLLVIICGCVGFFFIIDQLNLWCKVVPFLVPILGGTC